MGTPGTQHAQPLIWAIQVLTSLVASSDEALKEALRDQIREEQHGKRQVVLISVLKDIWMHAETNDSV